MDSEVDTLKILCRDIHGNAHLVDQDKLIKRQASYALIMQDQKLLLVCDRSGNSRWDFPGGGVDPGEDSLQALHREVQEETGLNITGDPELVCSFIEYFYDIDGQAGWESHRSYYKVATTGQANTAGNDDDITAIQAFALPLSMDLHLAPIVRLLVREAWASS